MKRASNSRPRLGPLLLLATVSCAELGSSARDGRELDATDATSEESIEVTAWPMVADAWARWLPTAAATSAATSAKGPHRVQVRDSVRLDLDAALGTALARGNVDAARFDGRVYLALRSTLEDGSRRIDVVSSEDGATFRRETTLGGPRNLHSARLLAFEGGLFAYASELAPDASELHPRGVFGTRLGGIDAEGGELWADWRPLDLPGQLVWRAKVERGVPLLTSYSLSDKRYAFDEAALEVRLLTTDDGFDWRPLRSGQQAVYRGGGSQAAFTSDDDGNLYSVVNRAAGDDAGFGSALCAAEGSDWARWDCVNDPKKYDSPTLFNHEGELYLVARRHAAEDGTYDQGGGFSLLRRAKNEAHELAARKRCALWHFDRAHKRVDFVLDLPSRGDTCAAAVIAGERPSEFVIYDHSSPLTGPDVSLQRGLQGPTHVYRHVVAFESVHATTATDSRRDQ